ncbi:hypothetical protein G7Y89_g15795 [Cudoniella acicularis]|uniref:Uncharacterized protein n=1 Tax=Cudoniella acicularis TaxID=354080 RepID=A0A8H4QFB6_9HELO|nr:hypothetical protein G7Y89_g15795 [Cudoniella acicularis]
MAVELKSSVSQFLSSASSETYAPIPTYAFIYTMILSVSSPVFVGLPLAHDQAWLDIVPFLASKKQFEELLTRAKKLLTPAIRERENLGEEQDDVLGFLVQSWEIVNPRAVILQLLSLNAAAIHASTTAAVHTLFDLCSMLEYMESLRLEAQEALKEDGDEWKLSTVKKLRTLDNFMKEPMRWNPPDARIQSLLSKSAREKEKFGLESSPTPSSTGCFWQFIISRKSYAISDENRDCIAFSADNKSLSQHALRPTIPSTAETLLAWAGGLAQGEKNMDD